MFKRNRYGLSFNQNLKCSILGIVLFVLLYMVICLLDFVYENIYLGEINGYAIKPDALIYVAVMAIKLLFSFTAFLGE